VVIPELARAGAPVAENARQAFETMRVTGPQDGRLTYTFLTNLRAYLALYDSVPKPYPFPTEGRKQFSELRVTSERLESHFRALLDRKELQLRNPDRANLKRYAEANQKLGEPQPGKRRVVFLGDSITDGWRLNEYFQDRDLVNRGIGGQITAQMLGRMKADVIDLKPALVLVLAGTNDISRGVPLAAIQNNLTMIADLAEANKIKPLFASLLPISDYHSDRNPRYSLLPISDYHSDRNPRYLRSKRRPPGTILALNDWLQGFCRQRNYIYVDYHSQLADADGFLRRDAANDGLHPNSAGYRLMAPVAQEAIDKALTPKRKKKKRLWPF
jgi:lysophospholipase L1-like esterase